MTGSPPPQDDRDPKKLFAEYGYDLAGAISHLYFELRDKIEALSKRIDALETRRKK